jgi:predicted glutamine amidotransferase
MRKSLPQLLILSLAVFLCLLSGSPTQQPYAPEHSGSPTQQPGAPAQPGSPAHPDATAQHADHACRFWGLIGSNYPSDVITDHLRDGTISNLRDLGGYNNDGWGFASFLHASDSTPLVLPLIRRGGPPANHSHDPDFDLAVDELIALSPKATLGHVRAGSSGHWGIPDPHPFQHEGMVFAHNGSVNIATLLQLLKADDPNYLKTHPPDYVEGYVDSELYFLYLLKYINKHPELPHAEALRQAVYEVTLAMSMHRLNFIATAGDTLFALRHAPGDGGDPVRYYPIVTSNETSPYWIVASQIMGSTAEGWGTIPAKNLAVFVPGQRPVFLPIGPEMYPSESLPFEVGPAQPNPVLHRVTIPIDFTAREGGEVTLEIWDSQGRLVWRDGPIRFRTGRGSLHWDGRNQSGNPVASGSYFCRVTTGKYCHEQTISIVR